MNKKIGNLFKLINDKPVKTTGKLEKKNNDSFISYYIDKSTKNLELIVGFKNKDSKQTTFYKLVKKLNKKQGTNEAFLLEVPFHQIKTKKESKNLVNINNILKNKQDINLFMVDLTNINEKISFIVEAKNPASNKRRYFSFTLNNNKISVIKQDHQEYWSKKKENNLIYLLSVNKSTPGTKNR